MGSILIDWTKLLRFSVRAITSSTSIAAVWKSGRFAGSTVALVRRDVLEGIVEKIQADFAEVIGRKPMAFSTRPSRGAYLIRG